MSTNESHHHQPHSPFLYVVVFIAAIAGLLFGYDTGVISGALLFVRQEFALSTGMQEIVTSVVLLGAVFGAASGGTFADAYGRRKALLVASVTFVLGALGAAVAPNPHILIVGRFVVGLAIGVASLAAPLYISEMAPKHIRGSLVSINQLAITFGIVVSYLVDYLLSKGGHWRWMFGLAAIPAGILFVGLLFLPQSPRWLVSKGDINKARTVLQRIRKSAKPGHPTTPQDIQPELAELQKSIRLSRGTWHDLFAAEVRPALWVGIFLALFQQLTGINTVIYYSPIIFQSAGFTSSSGAILATGGIGVVNMVFTLVAIFLIDKVGRRPLLFVGLCGMVVSLALLGLAFYLPKFQQSGWPAVVGLSLYVASFAIGLGPIFWLMIAEIFPIKVRGLGMGISSVVNWASNLVVALTFLSLLKKLGTSGTFWLYGAISIVAIVFVNFAVPETKGKTLEEIESFWHKAKE